MTKKIFQLNPHKEEVIQELRNGVPTKEIITHFPVSRRSVERYRREIFPIQERIDIVDIKDVPGPYSNNLIWATMRALSPDKAMKVLFLSKNRAVRQQRSILGCREFKISTRIAEENDKVYLYIWKVK